MTDQSKYWCFTLNNYSTDEEEAIKCINCSYVIYGKEIGESGTPHLQGYIELSTRRRFGAVKRLFPIRTHLEVRRGTAQQAREYCLKDDVSAYECGTISRGQGARNDLEGLHEDLKNGKSLKDIRDDHFANYLKYSKSIHQYVLHKDTPRTWRTQVRCYWGNTGTGKTRQAFTDFPEAYFHPGGPWFDGYEGDEHVIFDDFGGSEFKLTYLLKLLDRYPMRVPVKGGFTQWKPRVIVITSNHPPMEWYPNAKLEHVNALLRRLEVISHFQ